jgi:aryl-alcohol dehydrogenase-like predicted oxidoreductase
MTYRRLGRTGFMVSSIGLGGDDVAPDNNDFLHYAMDLGVNWFDTAMGYNGGRSEPGYAAVHKARGRENCFQSSKVNLFPNRTRAWRTIFLGLPDAEQDRIRNRVAEEIAQKGLEDPDYLGPYFNGQAGGLRSAMIANIVSQMYPEKIDKTREYRDYLIKSVEGTLRALHTDYLDGLLMRGVETPYEISHTPEVFEVFEQLKRQGKARHLGFSAHSDPAGVLNAAIDTGVYSVGLVAYHFLNHKWLGQVIEKAKKADFGVMCMKASRVLQNPVNRRQMIPERVRVLESLVPGRMTLFQKGFHWALQNPNLSVVVAGVSNMDMAKEDVPLALEKKV